MTANLAKTCVQKILRTQKKNYTATGNYNRKFNKKLLLERRKENL